MILDIGISPNSFFGRKRAGAATLLVCLAGAAAVHAQSSTKEYIHFGGSVIAIENQAVVITTAQSLPVATVGLAYSVTLVASGGIAPYTWTLNTGSSLPANGDTA